MITDQQPFRRIVTGHDADGNAIIVSDNPPSRTYMVGGPDGARFYELWHTNQTPASIESGPDEADENQLMLAPPEGGTRIRVIDFPVETDEIRNLSQQQARQHFKSMNGEQASTAFKVQPHPLMHRTESIDYGIVLEGELTLVLDKAETIIRAGDIVIQRGTNHAWANRGSKPCRVAFILISGKFNQNKSHAS